MTYKKRFYFFYCRELLDLSSNIIENVEEDAFLACTNLRELNLGQNNITFIFALPPSLQIFIMKQNTLHRWPQFPAGITYVDLSYNRLTEVYGEGVNLDNLEVIKSLSTLKTSYQTTVLKI